MARTLHPSRVRRAPTTPRFSAPLLPGNDLPTSPRDLAVASAAGAAVVSLLAGVVLALTGAKDVAVTPALALFPLIAAGATSTGVALWSSLRRRSSVAGLAGLALALGAGAALEFGLIAVEPPTWRGGPWWMGAAAAAYAALAVLVSRWPRSAPIPAPRAFLPMSDDRWCDDVAIALRSAGVPESHVHAIVADTLARADTAHHPLIDEFGPPARYAAPWASWAAARTRARRVTITAVVVGAFAACWLPTHPWSPSSFDEWVSGTFIALTIWSALAWCAVWRARRTSPT